MRRSTSLIGCCSSVHLVNPSTGPKDTAWRFTPWLFTPPVASMRADARFNELCDGTGLTDYWRKRGVQPDYRRFKD